MSIKGYFESYGFYYKPSVFQPSKMVGFDFDISMQPDDFKV